jgi:hypothetical protein
MVYLLVESIKQRRAYEETQANESRCIRRLVQMFWPGNSFLTFCDENGSWLHQFPRFHQKRVDVALGELFQLTNKNRSSFQVCSCMCENPQLFMCNYLYFQSTMALSGKTPLMTSTQKVTRKGLLESAITGTAT